MSGQQPEMGDVDMMEAPDAVGAELGGNKAKMLSLIRSRVNDYSDAV